MSDIKLLTFVCNWCSYGGADQAGGLKLEYPAGVRLVRVMCSGRVDPQTIIQSYRLGADGVLVLGCHPGNCHYKDGNLTAQRRAKVLEILLAQFGIEPARFRLDWVSAGEGERFTRVVTEAYEAVVALGPLKLHSRVVEEEHHP